ncbi:RNA polymerase sigma factor [Spirosoma montaniterrae]|uniref:RNA polymerase sigma-70 region 2 domain-containing protein n=1 Tax=Spirosoma montaniterrae TaxID=1178516 RepID=A0A1P9WX92_9BACT|nr:sigma-70 family RNA polymerase sigma factor [Spirosoma montaniterrae]AQG79995.1 hypothetical protein AWR27_12050 [Spirosoma montaniterrae]
MTSTLTDEELVSLFIKTQQATYFQAIYTRYYGMIYRYCRQYAHQHEEAKDLTQEVFIRLARGMTSFAGRARFKTWLCAVTHNYCLDYIHKQSRLRILYYDPESLLLLNLPDVSEQQNQQWEQLDTVMKQLKPAEIQLLTDFYFNRLPLNELAFRYQTKKSIIKTRLFRVRARLRQLYRERVASLD